MISNLIIHFILNRLNLKKWAEDLQDAIEFLTESHSQNQGTTEVCQTQKSEFTTQVTRRLQLTCSPR